MNRKRFYLPFFIIYHLFPLSLYAQMFGQTPDERKSDYDVENIKIEVTLDLENRTVNGKVTTSIRSLAERLSEFKVDAAGMNIKSVKGWIHNASDDPKLAEGFENIKYDYDNKQLTIKPTGGITKNFPYKYQVEYSVTNPEKGLYFIKPSDNHPDKRYEVWSQGEGEDNRYWFPCYDYPNDRAQTEMFITVDKKYQTLSNGILKDTKDNPDGTKTWHWILDKPISSYLVMLAVGNYDMIEDKYLDIPVKTYVPPGAKDMAVKSFDRTADIVKFFSENTGFKYPWYNFSQIVVQDFIYGGMENVGAVVLTDVSLYDDKTPPDYTATNLVAHELAHQWWGDAVTCKNWNEIWLNEGFATYFQCLYTEHAFGKDEFDYEIYRNGRGAITADSTVARKPIYARDGLTVNTYNKGSVVLNMLRNVLGTENFRKAMNIYITTNQFKNVTTQNLLEAVNKAMDNPAVDRMPLDYKWFFDEWVYKAGQPEYNVDYNYNDVTGQLDINVQQTQRMDSSSVFRTTVPLKIVMQNGKVLDKNIDVTNVSETFTIMLDTKPIYIVFNGGNAVLCKLHYSKPKQDWINQWHYSEDAIDRITALHGMVDFIDDQEIDGALLESLTKDSFWGVRNEAAVVLGKSKQSGAIDLLLEKYNTEPDPRVRRTILSSITNIKKNTTDFVDPKWLGDWILEKIKNEQSYYAIAEGISYISQILPKEKIFDAVSPFIKMDSHVDVIRRYTLDALKDSEDKRALEIFMEYAQKGGSTRTINNAIGGLGNFTDNEQVITLLNGMLLDNLRNTQNRILSVLEKAKNPSSKENIQKLYDRTNDEEFKKRVKEILDKF